MRKVLVLALDSLEYDLVEKYDFKNLKQVEYGKTILPVEHGEPIRTPAMWVSFITGKPPEVHGITGRKQFKGTGWGWLRRNIGAHLGFVKGKSKILEKLGVDMVREGREHLKVNTLFDYIPKSIYYNIPGYNESDENWEIRERMALAIEQHRGLREAREQMEEIYVKRREEFLDALEGDWELMMYHFFILDAMQHMFSWEEEYVESLYGRFEELTGIVQEKLGEDPDFLLLIVSDHGQSKGKHTYYGYYSSNRPLNLEDPKLTDFYQVTLDWLSKNPYTEEEEEIIAKRLRELGYIS